MMENRIENGEDLDLLRIIDEIHPNKLGSIAHSKYVKKISSKIFDIIKNDCNGLILLVNAIKDCPEPSYKRHMLLEVLNNSVFSDEKILPTILCDIPFRKNNRTWKGLANFLISLPDLVSNCGALNNFPRFKREDFYSVLLTELYHALRGRRFQVLKEELVDEQLYFYIQLLGRTAISGLSQLVWEKFTLKVILENDTQLKRLVSRIFTIPLKCGSACQFEIFIEPLYVPIFYNLVPSKQSGTLIKSILGVNILDHEFLQYTICNKCILQTNYTHDRRHQSMILFNIFSYLSSLTNNEEYLALVEQQKESFMNRIEEPNLLIKTLLEVTRSWSNNTKVLLRTYEQNRFITFALLIGFRYALENNTESLAHHSEEIQAKIIQGFPIYLNRASFENRNLVMSLGELMLPKLHELIDKYHINLADSKRERQTIELDFDVKWDDDNIDLKRFFNLEIDEIFRHNDPIDVNHSQLNSDNDCDAAKDECPESHSTNGKTEPISHDRSDALEIKSGMLLDSFPKPSLQQTLKQHSSKRAVIEMSSDDDDLTPYEMDCDDSDGDLDSDEVYSSEKDLMNVPIYLGDCIAGLSENNDPKFVRLCLIKAGELIDQLSASKEEANENNELHKYSYNSLQNYRYEQKVTKPSSDDAIRDIALEMIQLLLHLDNQYNIENFDSYRMKAMSALCVATPDLVVNYLLDEFNGTYKSTRHQLDILQALVIAARQMSGCDYGDRQEQDAHLKVDTMNGLALGNSDRSKGGNGERTGGCNRFVKYVSLFFYGIVHPLKADMTNNILPASIVSAAKSLSVSQSRSDSRRESMIRRVIEGLTSSNCKIRNNFDRNYGNLFFSSSSSTSETSIERQQTSELVEQGEEKSTTPIDGSQMLRRLNLSMTNSGSSWRYSEQLSSSSLSMAAPINEQTSKASSLESSCSLSPTPSMVSPTSPIKIGTETKRQQANEFCSHDENKQHSSTSNNQWLDDGQRLSRQSDDNHDKLDSSYLLSRVLFSVSLIIKCVNQQPITCKLSNDLLDILAAYRHHPDLGVRKAIVSCLTVIRDCTPSVYFNEYLYDKTLCLFKDWLARESELIQLIKH